MVCYSNMNQSLEHIIHILLRYCFINRVRFRHEHSGEVIFIFHHLTEGDKEVYKSIYHSICLMTMASDQLGLLWFLFDDNPCIL